MGVFELFLKKLSTFPQSYPQFVDNFVDNLSKIFPILTLKWPNFAIFKRKNGSHDCGNVEMLITQRF